MKNHRDSNTTKLLTSEESESLLRGMKPPEICAKRVPFGTSSHKLGTLSQREVVCLKDIIAHRKGAPARELSDNRKNPGR
jgi:hypothetical protein